MANQIVFEPLIDAVATFNNPELMKSQDWFGRKAFIAVNDTGQCCVVVLSFVDRFKRFFGAEKFANTRPDHLIRFLKDKDINKLIDKSNTGHNLNLFAAAFRIKKFSDKWLTIGRFLDQITRINPNADIPSSLYWHLKFPKIYLWQVEGENETRRPNGRIHHEIKDYFVKRHSKANILNENELQLWGRLTEVLKRMGWDISGDRIGTSFWGSPLDEMGSVMMYNAPYLVDFYLEHDIDPTVPFTGQPSAYIHLSCSLENAKRLTKHYKEKNIPLENVRGHTGASVLDSAAYNNRLEVMEHFVKEGNMTVTQNVLCLWICFNQWHKKSPNDPQRIMHLLTSVDQFTEVKSTLPEYVGQTPLEVYNAAVKKFNSGTQRERLKELTKVDIQAMFGKDRGQDRGQA